MQKQKFYRKAIALYSQALFSFLRSDYSTFMLDDIQHPELNFDSKHGPNQVASPYTTTLISYIKTRL